MRHLIENGGYSNIHIMPFRDITLPLYNMHPSYSGGASISVRNSLRSSADLNFSNGTSAESGVDNNSNSTGKNTNRRKSSSGFDYSLTHHTNDDDCTHYCYFPQMWQSIWYHLHMGAFR